MSAGRHSAQAQIDQLLVETGAADPREAVRRKARDLVALYCAQFGDPTMPVDLDVLASMLGITRSDDMPLYSPDAELVPDDGRLTMRVNPDRPETRQRFSVGHEISHTFFPDYAAKAWCRTDARYRDRNNPDDFLEMLCDIGAAELLFPLPWFAAHAGAVQNARGLVGLAGTYNASREATLRRYAEVSPNRVVAVFLSWKLKPTQRGTIGRPEQPNFWGTDPADDIREASRLRIDYAIPSPAFSSVGYFLPKDKSVENAGPLYDAATTGQPAEGDCRLELGQAAGVYRVLAVPLWTPDDELGPRGENAVAAVLEPLQVKSPKKATSQPGPGLFD